MNDAITAIQDVIHKLQAWSEAQEAITENNLPLGGGEVFEAERADRRVAAGNQAANYRILISTLEQAIESLTA